MSTVRPEENRTIMRLHTDTLTANDVYDAARTAGVTVVNLARHGSRTRHHAYEVTFAGSSNHGGQYGALDYAAATWDEWGIVLGVLFDRDRRMIAGGPNGYVGAVDYAWQTGDRFRRDLDSTTAHGPVVHAPTEQHLRHRWDGGGRIASGAYWVDICRCGALRRSLGSGFTREDIGLDVPAREDATV